MTEEEAKTKWCPHAVASHTDPRGIMGYERPEIGLPVDTFIHACIGSRCMAWRDLRDTATETTRSSQRPAGDGWLPGPGYDDWTRTRSVSLGGYCGLAGAPQ